MGCARRFRIGRRHDVSNLGIACSFADAGPADPCDIFFGGYACCAIGWRRLEGTLPVDICFARFRGCPDSTVIWRFRLGAPPHQSYRHADARLVRDLSTEKTFSWNIPEVSGPEGFGTCGGGSHTVQFLSALKALHR